MKVMTLMRGTEWKHPRRMKGCVQHAEDTKIVLIFFFFLASGPVSFSKGLLRWNKCGIRKSTSCTGNVCSVML